jgi:hypothetical protein
MTEVVTHTGGYVQLNIDTDPSSMAASAANDTPENC